MTKYQLAKLVEMAGGRVETRKSLQKFVFMLKAAGCRIDATYHLHYYGPYSKELADLVNEVTSQGMLIESASHNGAGTQYAYTLRPEVAESMRRWEETDGGREEARKMEVFRDRLVELVAKPLREVELASTVLFYKNEKGSDWAEAIRQASDFKAEAESSPVMARGAELARRFLPSL